MLSLRDVFLWSLAAALVEAYALSVFAPQFKSIARIFQLFFVNGTALFVWKVSIYPNLFSPLRKLPGPKGGWPILENGSAMFVTPHGEAYRQWCDDIPNDGLIRFKGLMAADTLVPTSSETLKAVLTEHTYDYEKPSEFANALRPLLGNGLVLSEGHTHKKQRKGISPSFQLKQIRDLHPLFWAKSCEFTSTLNSGKAEFEVDFWAWCMRAALDIIGVAAFGRDFNSVSNPDSDIVIRFQDLTDITGETAAWFALVLLCGRGFVRLLPWKLNQFYDALEKFLRNWTMGLVHELRTREEKDAKLEDEEKPRDVMSLLVRSKMFGDWEMADQALTFLQAGHETTSNTLSWCALLLSQNPEIQQKVRDEVRAALPSPTSGKTPSAVDVDSLPWLSAVCMETLRLYPVIATTLRRVTTPTVLMGHKLPVGTNVIISPWAINRCKRFWGPDAEVFKPERWLDAQGRATKSGGAESNYAFMTFSHGPRSCIGQAFAQAELKCMVATVVGRYEFTALNNPAPIGTSLKPEGGLPMRMKVVPGW